MTIIRDGTGSGKKLKINSENQAETNAVYRPLEEHVNEVEHKS